MDLKNIIKMTLKNVIKPDEQLTVSMAKANIALVTQQSVVKLDNLVTRIKHERRKDN